MKPSLQLRASQHLALTPQLQQSIRLLQLSTLELQTEIEQALQENPLLEREESSDGTVDWRESVRRQRLERTRSGDRDIDDDVLPQAAPEPDLTAHLLAQVRLLPLSERDMALLGWLIGELDDNGYLLDPFEELLAQLPGDLEVDITELRAVRAMLQSLDPPGVGAASVAECLGLQLRSPDLSRIPEVADAEVLAVARAICARHLPLLAARDYGRLRRELGCSDDVLRAAQSAIQRLQPRPGAAHAHAAAPYVLPDVIVRKVGNRWQARLNDEVVPRLQVNDLYARIVKSERGSSLSDHLREARWFVRNIQQRYDTIARVAHEIVERQQGFFEHGAIAMRPLVLRDIADVTGLHESTISRVTTQKYMLTPQGMFEFKHFFGSQVATQGGGAASSTAVQTLLKQLIGAEDARKPLSDAKLAAALAEQGMVVARRTVAKYREAMNIPPASQRKAL